MDALEGSLADSFEAALQESARGQQGLSAEVTQSSDAKAKASRLLQAHEKGASTGKGQAKRRRASH